MYVPVHVYAHLPVEGVGVQSQNTVRTHFFKILLIFATLFSLFFVLSFEKNPFALRIHPFEPDYFKTCSLALAVCTKIWTVDAERPTV